MGSDGFAEERSTGRASAFAGLAVLALVAAFGARLPRPPAREPDAVPETEFSEARARSWVRTIAAEPHPLGSEAHELVRGALVAGLGRLGLAAEVRHATVARPWRKDALEIDNIIARIPGRASTRAVALVAHYDSAREGPGAGDDAAGVAAILETARALLAGPPLRNDVLILITDGEERGLLGARAFVADAGRAADIGVLLNFEARGCAGPSYMFETSDGNAALIADFAAAAPWPVASSLAASIYKLMPNDTDFTIFRRAGVEGLNFAFIDGFDAYHTERDTPERLDPRSLAHHGSYALALARRFGDADLAPAARAAGGGDAIFFNAAGRFFVYPGSWAWPVTGAMLAAVLLAAALAFRARVLTARGLAFGFAVLLGAMIAAALVVTGASHAVLRGLHAYTWYPFGGTPHDGPLFVGAAGLAVVVAATVYAWAARRTSAENLATAALIFGAETMVASAVWLPGGTFFAWGTLCYSLGLAFAFARPAASPALRVAVLVAAAVPGVLIQAAAIRGLLAATTISLSALVVLTIVPQVGALWQILDLALGRRPHRAESLAPCRTSG